MISVPIVSQSYSHKLISQIVHFAMWTSTNPILIVQLTPILRMFPGTTNQCCLETWLYVLGLVAEFCLPQNGCLIWIYSSCAGEASVEVASDSESCWSSCRSSGLWDSLKWPHAEATFTWLTQNVQWAQPNNPVQSTCTYGNFCRCPCVCVYMACMYTLHACMCGVCVLVCVY